MYDPDGADPKRTQFCAVADNPPTDASTFRESIAAQLLHVATQGERCVGFTLALARGADCHLEQMSVDPSTGRQGIGSAMLRQLIDTARSRGYARVTLSTFNNLAWNGPYYARFGFVELSDLTPALVEVRREEAGAGLDMSLRSIMALSL